MKSSILLMFCAAWTMHAAPIVSVTGVPTGGAAAGQQQILTTGFTLGQDYSNVSISAVIGGLATQSVTAYLTTQIGAGTTPGSDEVTSTTIPLPGPGPNLTNLFTGLSLSAGTYYLTLFHPTDTAGSWYHSSAAVVATAPGSSQFFDGYYITNFPGIALPAYAPAATFAPLMSFDDPPLDSDFLFVVETTDIPEPGTASLAALTLAAFAGCLYRRRAR